MEQPSRNPAPRTARGPKQVLAWILSGALLVAALGLVVVKVRESRVVEDPHFAPHETDRAELAALFQEAKDQIRAGKWTAARENLLKLQFMAPDFTGLKDYLEQVEKEIPNQEHLEAAQKALAGEDLAVARTELAKISSDTTMLEKVSEVQRALRNTLDEHLRLAQEAFDNKEYLKARSWLDEVLAGEPDNKKAQELFEQLAVLDQKAATPPSPEPPPTPSEPTGSAATDRFLAGDLPRATTIAQGCAPKDPQCKRLLKKLKQFTRLFERLEKLSPQELRTLLDLEKDITGPKTPSQVFRTASPSAVQRLYRGALAEKAAGQWNRALEFAQHVLLADPNHQGAKGIIQLLRMKAGELSIGYPTKELSPEELIARYRLIMELTQPEDEAYQKAKSWLDKIER